MRIFRLTAGIIFMLIILTGCTSEHVPKIESIDNILNCPMLFRNGIYTNPYPAIDLDSIEVLPVYSSKWNDEKGVEELNTFLNEFDIDEHDGIVYSNESCVRYISDDAIVRFDSSYQGIGFTYAVDPYPETLIDIDAAFFEYSFLPDSSGVNISETAEKELCNTLTTYINSHKDLFGSADKLNITDAQIWSSFREKNDIRVVLECIDFNEEKTEDILLNYFGLRDNFKITLFYSEESCGWEGISIDRYSADRFSEIGTYSIIPYDEAKSRFEKNDEINYFNCRYDDITDWDIFLVYVMDSKKYIRPIYISTSSDFAFFGDELGICAWIDAIEY